MSLAGAELLSDTVIEKFTLSSITFISTEALTLSGGPNYKL